MSTVFFSYARKDSDFVLKLAQDLKSASIPVWLDQLNIKGGQHWDDSIQEALRSCSRQVVVLSRASVASENVMDEVNYAIEQGKQVIPILLEECDVPFRLRRLHHIDFTGAQYDGGLQRLIEDLRATPIPSGSVGATGDTPDAVGMAKPMRQVLPDVQEAQGGHAVAPARPGRKSGTLVIAGLVALVAAGTLGFVFIGNESGPAAPSTNCFDGAMADDDASPDGREFLGAWTAPESTWNLNIRRAGNNAIMVDMAGTTTEATLNGPVLHIPMPQVVPPETCNVRVSRSGQSLLGKCTPSGKEPYCYSYTRS